MITNKKTTNNDLDEYDRETLIKISNKHPVNKSIQFLLRIISLQKTVREKIEKELQETKKLLRVATNPTNIKGLDEVKREHTYKNIKNQLKAIQEKSRKLKIDNSRLITDNLRQAKEIAELKAILSTARELSAENIKQQTQG